MKNGTVRRRTTRELCILLGLITTAFISPARKGTAELSPDRHVADIWAFDLPQSLGPTINSPLFEGGPTVSADERTLIFAATRDAITQQEDLFVSQRTSPDASWGTPELLPPTVTATT